MYDEIIIKHEGFLDYRLLNKLLSKFMAYVEANRVDNYIFKKVQIVMVEMLENNYQYTQSILRENNFEQLKPEFTINRIDKGFKLIASNPIYSVDVVDLKKTIDHINSTDLKNLRTLYKKILKEGIHSKKATAGIGLLRIAKVTKNKIDYSFRKIDNKLLYYTLEITVNPK